MLRAMSEPLPPHTSAKSAIPQPADSSSSSAVARRAAHEKMSRTEPMVDQRLHQPGGHSSRGH
jgi:hypothetical protein